MAISALTIPTNIGPTSYTGLGSSWQDFSANTVQPVLSNLSLSKMQGSRSLNLVNLRKLKSRTARKMLAITLVSLKSVCSIMTP